MGGEWRETTLGDVIELKRGYDLPQRERRPGFVPLVSSSGVTDYQAKPKVKGPGVVTGRYGTLGQVFFIPGDFWPLNTTLYIRDFKGNDPRFVSYFLRSLDFLAYSDKAAVPGINRNHLHQAEVRVPGDVSEQRRIASILGALDDKIELNRQMNRTLEEMPQAIFKSWFIDFDGHDDLVESELGLIPRGWEVTTVEGHFTLDKGLSYKSEFFNDFGLPLVNLKCIQPEGGFRVGGLKFYEGEFKDRHVIRPGDIVIAMTDLTQKREVIASPARIPRILNHEYAIMSLDLAAPRARATSPLSKNWLYGLMKTRGFKDFARGFATGTTVLHLHKDGILGFSFALPPRERVMEFNAIAECLVARQFVANEEAATLTVLRDALLPKLISGEICVPEAEEILEDAL